MQFEPKEPMTGPSIRGKRICVVDDDPQYCELLSVLLGGLGARVSEVGSGPQLLDLLKRETFDCVLLDNCLQTESGLGVLASVLAQLERAPPVVMITGTENQRTIIKAFRCGVSDYVLKRDMQPEELVTVLHRAIARHEQENAVRAELTRLKERTGFDDVTGLYSMAAVEERMTAIAASPKRPFGIILIVFNEYQHLAERFGSVVADKALRVIAGKLRAAVRQVDICGRRPPRTFIYLVDADFDAQTMEAIVRRLKEALTFTMKLPEVSLDVSVSVGMAVRSGEGESANRVLGAAERALANALKQASEGATSPAPNGKAASNGSPEADPVLRTADRRREPRQRVLKQARIESRDPPLNVTCTVRDQSSLGVRLRIEAYFNVPQQFDLIFVNSSERRQASKVWQNGREVGVEFQ